MLTIYHNVAPRYTPCSPASVSGEIALRVAAEERDAFPHYLDGLCGEREQQRAQTLGLGGIVEERWERADCWIVTDLITGARFVRPFRKDGETREQRIVRLGRLETKYGLPVEAS